MKESPIRDVTDTAILVAAFRARETERSDALFHDPLAARLIGERGKQILDNLPVNFMGGWNLVIRTVIIDTLIEQAVAQGVDTVLNLGAGLDTRPYRMTLPEDLRWVEVDYDRVIEPKADLLKDETPHCRLDRVSLDLADADARGKMLADIDARGKNVLVLTEGVVPYLTESQVADLADDLRRRDHIHRWIVDYFSPLILKYRRRGKVGRQMKNAPFRFHPDDWFGFFAAHGWGERDVRYVGEVAERLGRPIPLPTPMKVIATIRALFLSQERREEFRKIVGFVVLEPI